LLPPSKLGIYLEGLAKKQKWKFDICRRLVVFYAEFGFIECAKDFLQYIKNEFKDDNLAQVFVINWQKKLESRMYSGFAEMDAVKIFERIERFLKVKQYKKASEEIDILVEHFKNTKTFVDNRQKVVNWMGQKWYRRNQK
jgi:hypothetical protein